MQLNYICILLISAFLLLNCTSSTSKHNKNKDYEFHIKQWHKKRIERLKAKDGWLSLAGLYWLEEGKNTFGKDSSNDFIINKEGVPPYICSFILHNGEVRFETRKGIEVLLNENPVQEVKLQNDSSNNPSILKLGSLSWFIIKRGEKLGVRLRDSENPQIKKLKDIPTFPISPEWKVNAVFKSYDKPRKIKIPTVLGTIQQLQSPGKLEFQFKGKTYQLHPLGDGGDFFVVFGDKTNTVETYGSGRFLSVEGPDKNGNTFIDFNKAYNPPCVFSHYATCPLPPEKNILPIRVTAGEKNIKE